MAAEEDNFDIDIYGDGGEDYHQESPHEDGIRNEGIPESSHLAKTDIFAQDDPTTLQTGSGQEVDEDMKLENGHLGTGDLAQKIASTDESTQDTVHLPKQAPQTQGLKRKDGADDRFVDPGATTALFISELHWWVTDDDVRGWANQSQCEDELEDITFSEHKVNGKSKGWASTSKIVKSAIIRNHTNYYVQLIGKHMSCLNHHRQRRQPSKKSSPSVKVNNIRRNSKLIILTLSRIPFAHFQRMDLQGAAIHPPIIDQRRVISTAPEALITCLRRRSATT